MHRPARSLIALTRILSRSILERATTLISSSRFLFVRLVLLPALAFLPARLAFGIVRWRGRRRYARLDPALKALMRRDVQQVCGEPDEVRVEAILEEAQEIISCDEMDPYLFLRPGRLGSDTIIALEGLQHLEEATRRGGGAILFSAHFGGGYSFLVALGSRGYRPCAIFAPTDRFPLAQRVVFRVRVALMRWTSNVTALFTGRASLGHEILVRLREGNTIVLLLDGRPDSHAKRAVRVEFLGRQCRLSYGVLDLVAKSGAPLLPFFVYYTGPHLRRAVIGRPVELVTHPDPLVARTMNLRRCLERIEEAVLRAPSHWMVWGYFEGLWSPDAERAEVPTPQDLRR